MSPQSFCLGIRIVLFIYYNYVMAEDVKKGEKLLIFYV